MLKTLIQPQPAPLHTSRSLRCLLHHRRTSFWERVGGELRLREDFSLCVCVSRFLEGLTCQKTQGRHRTHKHKMHTNTLQMNALKEATL